MCLDYTRQPAAMDRDIHMYSGGDFTALGHYRASNRVLSCASWSRIPPERLESIFEFGFSASGPRVKMSAGLATAYSIVQEHGGDIEIESEVDVGTTVTVRLPRRTAA